MRKQLAKMMSLVAVLAAAAVLTVAMFAMAGGLSIDDRMYLPGENLLVNPDFEQTQDANANEGNVFVGWEWDLSAGYGLTFYEGGPARSGMRAGVTFQQSDFWLKVSQKNVTVAQAGTYEASIWVSRGTGSFPVTELRVWKGDQQVGTATLVPVENNTNEEYRNLHIQDMELEAGDYTLELYVECKTDPSLGGFVRVDDAFFGAQQGKTDEEEVVTGNLLKNGSFDNPVYADWDGPISPSEDGVPHTGEAKPASYWRSESFDMAIRQEVRVPANGTYDAGVWLKRAGGSGTNYTYTEVRIWKAGESAPLVTGENHPVGWTGGSWGWDDDYIQVAAEGVSLERGTYIYEIHIAAELADGCEGTYAWIDDAYFELHQEPEQELGNLLTDPGFDECSENPEDGVWVTPAGFNPAPDDPGHTNEKAAASIWFGSSPYDVTVSHAVKVPKAGKYDAIIWVQRGGNTVDFTTTELNIKKDGETIATKGIECPDIPDWGEEPYAEIIVEDISLEAGEYVYELHVAGTHGGGGAYIRLDDVYFGPHQEPPVEPESVLQEPSFENDYTAYWTVPESGFTNSTSDPGHTGEFADASIWFGSSPFDAIVSQTVTVAKAGQGNAGIWVQRGGVAANFTTTALSIKKGDEVVATVAVDPLEIDGWNSEPAYLELALADVSLEAGEYTYELHVVGTCSDGAWIRLDDAYFEVTPAPEEKPGDSEEQPGDSEPDERLDSVLKNTDFEESDGEGFANWNIDWELADEDGTVTVEAEKEAVRFGSAALKAGANRDYAVTISQTVTIEEAGEYLARIWVAHDMWIEYEDTALYIRSKDGTELASANLWTSGVNSIAQYKHLVIPSVMLNAGDEVTFELCVAAPVLDEETTVSFKADDALLTRIGDYAKTPDVTPDDEDDTTTSSTTAPTTPKDDGAGDTGGADSTGSDSPATGNGVAVPAIVLMTLAGAVAVATLKKSRTK